MQYVVLGVMIAFGVALAVAGVAGLLTGWIHPWERGRVTRPVPHGIGQLLLGTGLSWLLSVVAFVPTGGVFPPLLAVGAVLFVAGVGLLGVSTLP